MKDLVCVQTYFNRESAEIARSVLEANDIRALVLADDCGGVRPHLQLTEGVKLLVNRLDAEKARSVLETSVE